MTKVIKREAIYIRSDDLAPSLRAKLIKDHKFRFYEQRSCKDCDNLPERHNDICDICPAFLSGADLAKRVVVNDTKYVKIPVGSWKTVRPQLRTPIQFIDKSPMREIRPFKFTGTFKPGQEEAIDASIKKRYGILKSPPRSGKTVMGAAMVAKLGLKTLILAAQLPWLNGFKETFVGSSTQIPLTDLKPSRIKLCKTFEDFKTHDVCLATVATFYSDKGVALLKRLRDMFSVVIIDEIQTAAAPKYNQIIAQLNSAYAIGLSGTPERKDTRDVLTDAILGPVIHEMKVERMRPSARLIKTQYTKQYKGNAPWHTIVSSLENNLKRLKLIAEWAVRDIKDGHLVIIPFLRVKPINTLVGMINEMYGKNIARPYHGGIKEEVRDRTIMRARDYKVKCLVGNVKMVSVGVNIPRASCLYECTLSSNLPNAEQRVSRILTVYADKPTPMLRIFLDDLGARRSCLANEWYNKIKPHFKPVMTKRDAIAFDSYLKLRNQRSVEGIRFD